MNREIKFRGRAEGDWFFGDLTHVLHRQKQMMCVAQTLVEQDTVGQFTGLYDKNGKEIYEGDVLRFYFNGNEYIVYVGFNSEVGAWCVGFKGSRNVGIRPLGVWLCEYKCIEVIGNIHDNPELIKEQQQ